MTDSWFSSPAFYVALGGAWLLIGAGQLRRAARMSPEEAEPTRVSRYRFALVRTPTSLRGWGYASLLVGLVWISLGVLKA